jgi:hypothetical protein
MRQAIPELSAFRLLGGFAGVLHGQKGAGAMLQPQAGPPAPADANQHSGQLMPSLAVAVQALESRSHPSAPSTGRGHEPDIRAARPDLSTAPIPDRRDQRRVPAPGDDESE